MQLAELQQKFSNALTEDEPKTKKIFYTLIHETQTLSAEERLGIYRMSTKETLIEALSDVYPVCKKLVGTGFFRTMGHFYGQQKRSVHPDLGEYTKDFARFIESYGPAKSCPYLTDVARLELAWFLAFCGPEVEPFDVAALANVSEADQGRLIFELPQNACLMQSPYPILKIWRQNMNDEASDEVIRLEEGGCYLFIWRKRIEVLVDQVEPTVFQLLEACQSGMCLEKVHQQYPTLPLDSILPKCMQKGWFECFRLEGEDEIK